LYGVYRTKYAVDNDTVDVLLLDNLTLIHNLVFFDIGYEATIHLNAPMEQCIVAHNDPAQGRGPVYAWRGMLAEGSG
jgi:hypothetical protein